MRRGAVLALGSAALYGLTTPFTAMLTLRLGTFTLAAALYLGAGVLALVRRGRIAREEWPWLLASAAVGGVAGPVLLVAGLRHTDAATASLLLATQAALTIAGAKGLLAGSVSLALAFATGGAARIDPAAFAAALAVGLVGYGISVALFVAAQRDLGTARTAAYFGAAPAIGAAAALAFGARPNALAFVAAATLTAIGIALHASERHVHGHRHEPLVHEHEHEHDEHHRHAHAHGPAASAGPHAHAHRHEPLAHAHPHAPDLHHRHDHHHA
jgi:drug/metabolite transporter (DMT)-like permease